MGGDLALTGSEDDDDLHRAQDHGRGADTVVIVLCTAPTVEKIIMYTVPINCGKIILYTVTIVET